MLSNVQSIGQGIHTQGYAEVKYGTDDGLIVSFGPYKADDDFTETEPEMYISIRQAGTNKSEVHRKMRDEDRRRFAKQWDAYTRNSNGSELGTPISFLPGLRPNQVEHLTRLGVVSVEILAGLSETGLEGIGMGARSLQQRGLAYLEANKVDRVEQVAGEARELAQANQGLSEQLRIMAEQLQFLMAREVQAEPVKRGRGRPPKVQSAPEPEPDDALDEEAA